MASQHHEDRAGDTLMADEPRQAPCWLRHNECCCNCKHHLTLTSHPWVNGLSIMHQIGWVCAVAVAMDKGIGGRWCQLSREHGACELYDRAEDGPVCEQTKEELATFERKDRERMIANRQQDFLWRTLRQQQVLVNAVQREVDHARMGWMVARRGLLDVGRPDIGESFNGGSFEYNEMIRVLEELNKTKEKE